MNLFSRLACVQKPQPGSTKKTLGIIEKEYDPENPNFNIIRTNLIGLYEKWKEAGGAEFQRSGI